MGEATREAMDTLALNDRSRWPEGPWTAEPDRAEWRSEAGLPALAVRVCGHWCGYVAVPPGHPAHGMGYADDALAQIEVHGGLTYAAACFGYVCHVPEPGEPDDVWWLGFDCAHGGDANPQQSEWLRALGAYRDIAFVREQCETLARQLADMAPEAGR